MVNRMKFKVMRHQVADIGSEWRCLELAATNILNQLTELSAASYQESLEAVSKHVYRFLDQLDSILERDEIGE